MSDVTASAFDLAGRGLAVFATGRGLKRPDADGWQARASADPSDVIMSWPPDSNVLVSTAGLVVLDPDAKYGDPWALLAPLGDLPPTFTVRSANGGLHLYFNPPVGETFQTRAYAKFKTGIERFAIQGVPGVDVRAEGGLVVGPGSEFDGKPYVIERDVPIAMLPAHVAAMLRAAPVRKKCEPGETRGEIDGPDQIEAARAYLETADGAVEGAGGDNATIAVANRVMDFGVSPLMAASLMSDVWDNKCSPPWGLEDLEFKCASAARSRQEPIGRNNPEISDAFGVVIAPKPACALEYPEDVDLDAIIARQSNAIVRGLIHPGDTAVIYGDSGAGKTFVALDIGWHVAQGKEWHGRKVKQAPALFVALEGVDGFQKRVLAARDAHGTTGKFLARLTVHVSMVRADAGLVGARRIIEAYKQLHAASETTGPQGLIFIDTLARAIAGDDENSTEDMTHFVEHRAGFIARETGAAVVIIHHTNKAGEMRGSGALKGACDVVLRAERMEALRSFHAEKVKDGEEGKLWDYSLRVVPLGRDADNIEVNSCVVRPVVVDIARVNACMAVLRPVLVNAITRGERMSKHREANTYALAVAVRDAPNALAAFSAAEHSAALDALAITTFEWRTTVAPNRKKTITLELMPSFSGSSE